MIKLFGEIPHLEGETLVLGRIRPEDLDALRELTEDDAVYRCCPRFSLSGSLKTLKRCSGSFTAASSARRNR